MSINTVRTDLPPSPDSIEYVAWWYEILGISEAAKARKVHVATITRDGKRKGQLIQLSERALGMRRGHALMLEPPPGYGAGISPRRRRGASPA